MVGYIVPKCDGYEAKAVQTCLIPVYFASNEMLRVVLAAVSGEGTEF